MVRLALTKVLQSYDYSHEKPDGLIEIIIESGAKLFVCAVGIPPARVVKRLHEGGVLYMNMVCHPHHAQKVIDAVQTCSAPGEEKAAGIRGIFPQSF